MLTVLQVNDEIWVGWPNGACCVDVHVKVASTILATEKRFYKVHTFSVVLNKVYYSLLNSKQGKTVFCPVLRSRDFFFA